MDNTTVFNIVLKHGQSQANLYMVTDYSLPISVGESVYITALLDVPADSVEHYVAKRERHVQCKLEAQDPAVAQCWHDDLLEAGYTCWQASGIFKATKSIWLAAAELAAAQQQPAADPDPAAEQLAWLDKVVGAVVDYLHQIEVAQGSKSYLTAVRHAQAILNRAQAELVLWQDYGLKPDYYQKGA